MGAGFAQALFALDAADGSVNAGSLVWNGLLQALLGYVQLDSLEAPSDRKPPFLPCSSPDFDTPSERCKSALRTLCACR